MYSRDIIEHKFKMVVVPDLLLSLATERRFLY
jgi:hypothetical protein